MSVLEIRKHHASCHELWGPVQIEVCTKCMQDKITCERKVQFGHWRKADAVVRTINELSEYRRPITRYRCRWCDLWHMTSRMNRPLARRVERMRRKWLTEQELGRRHRPELVSL